MIKFNGAFLRPPINRPLSSTYQTVKFVDDGAIATSIDMKATLLSDSTARPLPLNFNERTGRILPANKNLLQSFVTNLEEFAIENRMQINETKLM